MFGSTERANLYTARVQWLLSFVEFTMSRQITYAELCQHNTEENLWLLIDNKGMSRIQYSQFAVYDVTKFIPEVCFDMRHAHRVHG